MGNDKPGRDNMIGMAQKPIEVASQLTVAYDARPLQPQTRHWGPGVVVQNILSRLISEFQFVGLAHKFRGPDGLVIRAWPAIPKLAIASFEVSPALAGLFDVYWGTNHHLPQVLKKPSVTTVHDLLFVNRMDSAGKLRDRLLGWRFVSSIRRAHKIITDSRTTANDLISLFPEVGTKVEVGLLGFDSLGITSGGMPSRLLQPTGAYVIMLGCHALRKNPRLAFEAVGQARSTGAKISLAIVGNVDPAFDPLIQANSSLLRRLGVLPKVELFAVLRNAVALLFPSLYEGFGLPLLEGMAAGCPVLALDTPINREVGGNGAWLLADDPKQWADAIKTLMTSASARTELRERGRENLIRFSWDKTAKLYGEVFKEVAQ